jgi:pyrophosphatase PpaX
VTPVPLRYPLVLFDLDGTLLDTVPFIAESHQHAWMKHTGHRGDPARILSTIGRPIEFAFDDAAPELRQAMGESYLAHNLAHNDASIGIFLGVPRLLDGLAGIGAKTGIVTSKRRAITMHCLSLFSLAERFDLVVGKEDTVRHKPFPDPLRFAMARMGVGDPARVLYVGDSIHDLKSAQNAGMPCALVGWTRMDRSELDAAGPDFWIDEPDDLVLACLPGGSARLPGVSGGPGPYAAWRRLGVGYGPGSGRDEEVVFAVVRPADGRVAVVHGSRTPEDAFRLPSGGRARQEELVAAVLREAREEIGLREVRVVGSAGRMTHRFDDGAPFRSTLLVLETSDAVDAPCARALVGGEDGGEIDGIRWVQPQELSGLARGLSALGGDWRGWGALRAATTDALGAHLVPGCGEG